MIPITLTWTSTFKPKEITKAATRALKKAGSEALRSMRAEASRQIRQKKRFKVSGLNKAMKLNYPKGGDINDLVWSMDVSGDPVPVSAFTVRQTKAGVTALINTGGRTTIKSAFLATMDSGHSGVFYRLGKERLPIDEMFTTGPAAVVQSPGTVEGVQEKTRVKFQTAFERLIGLELGK